MANKVQKQCKICGRMFTPCADCENDKTMFRWKRVACSPECAKEYFAKIEESRQLRVKTLSSQPVEMENIETVSVVSAVTTEIGKSKRTRKKNIENEEREQID